MSFRDTSNVFLGLTKGLWECPQWFSTVIVANVRGQEWLPVVRLQVKICRSGLSLKKLKKKTTGIVRISPGIAFRENALKEPLHSREKRGGDPDKLSCNRKLQRVFGDLERSLVERYPEHVFQVRVGRFGECLQDIAAREGSRNRNWRNGRSQKTVQHRWGELAKGITFEWKLSQKEWVKRLSEFHGLEKVQYSAYFVGT